MRSLYREFRDLLDGPEALALAVICLVLGAGDFLRLDLSWDACYCSDRLRQIAAAFPWEELLGELSRGLPWLR